MLRWENVLLWKKILQIFRNIKVQAESRKLEGGKDSKYKDQETKSDSFNI